jgi:outer membrane protein
MTFMSSRSFFRSSLRLIPALHVAGIPAVGAPLALPDAIQLALSKNYALRVDALEPEIARARVTAELGRFDPNIELAYHYSEDASQLSQDPFDPVRPASSLEAADTYRAGLGGYLPFGTTYSVGLRASNSRGTFNNYVDRYITFAGIEVEQPLLRGFGFNSSLASLRIARTDRARSEWEYRQAIMDTITQVIFVYEDLHFALQSLRVAQRSRELAEGLVAENERRFRVGSMSEYDVTAARARAAQREESILLAQRRVEDARNFLRQLISDKRSLELLGENAEITAPVALTRPLPQPGEDFKRALELRPDYQQARLMVKRAELAKKYNGNQLLPEVNFIGSYGYHGFGETYSQSREQLRGRDRRSFSAGTVVRVPLTFSEGRGRYRAAKLELRQAEAELEQLEQHILVLVANAAGDIETARKRVEATTAARALAQATLDAEIKKLRAGTSSTFVVLQIQEQLAQAEMREFQARADEQKAIAEYDRQIGTTLQTWRIEVDRIRE